MANKRKKNRVLSIFKDDTLKVTFYYKPNLTKQGELYDIYHIIIINDEVRIKLINFGNIIVIEECLSMKQLTNDVKNTMKKIIKAFINQTNYNILISKLGNISDLNDICNSLNLPVVEDDRYVTIPMMLYKQYLGHFNNPADCGFYLVSIQDKIDGFGEHQTLINALINSISPTDEDVGNVSNTKIDDVAENQDIQYDDGDTIDDTDNDKKPLTATEVIEYTSSTISSWDGYTVTNIENDVFSKSVSVKINGTMAIRFIVTSSTNEISLSGFVIPIGTSYIDLLDVIKKLIDEFKADLTITIHTNSKNTNIVQLCDILDMKLISSNQIESVYSYS